MDGGTSPWPVVSFGLGVYTNNNGTICACLQPLWIRFSCADPVCSLEGRLDFLASISLCAPVLFCAGDTQAEFTPLYDILVLNDGSAGVACGALRAVLHPA